MAARFFISLIRSFRLVPRSKPPAWLKAGAGVCQIPSISQCRLSPTGDQNTSLETTCLTIPQFTLARYKEVLLMNIKDSWMLEVGLLLIDLMVILLIAAWIFGFRVNITPSLPEGIYQFSSEDIERNDLVAFCLEPDNPFSPLASERGYLGPGGCQSGLRPLLKHLVGLPSDHLFISDDGLILNGIVLTGSGRPGRDRQGRELPISLLREGTISDGQAGLEHLGRATATGVDRLIVVVEPGKRSVGTARVVKKLAADIGLNRVSVVGNKIRNQSDEDFLRRELDGLDLLGFIPYADSVVDADRNGASV
ncbi:hypothetical protein C4J81_06500 [Deltaproteobacteria bacterium Smac51]|nr:hypothetical protein C4J81_06500 [Deltaproteobacteria bacterium Smac51]